MHWNCLARAGRMWKRCIGRNISERGHRAAWRSFCLRVNGAHDGVCYRAHFGVHLNPAVSAGLWAGGGFPARDLAPYIVSQLIGAVLGAAILYFIASGAPGFSVNGGFASNGYAEHSPGHYSLAACFISEVAMTFGFLFVILGSTHGRAPKGFAPIAIGLCLTLIHLVSIPVTNTSVNPARSTGPALFAGSWALSQLWLFWLAPIIGALAAGGVYRWLGRDDEQVIGEPDLRR